MDEQCYDNFVDELDRSETIRRFAKSEKRKGGTQTLNYLRLLLHDEDLNSISISDKPIPISQVSDDTLKMLKKHEYEVIANGIIHRALDHYCSCQTIGK